MNSKVSVIITTYKGHKEVEYAVLSVINQSYKNIEIIVVDDNGMNTNEQKLTKNRLKKYVDKNMIKYITHKKNINGSAARNTGAQAATGEWLTFLDDDDIYLENKVEKEIKEAIKHNYDMVVCGGYFVNKNGYGYKSNFKSQNNLLLNYLTEKTLFNSSSIFIKKEKFWKINGFDDSFKRHQDWEFCARAIINLKVKTIKSHQYIKYTFGRNVAQNAETAETYLNHFLDKIGPILKEYSKTTYEKIKNYQIIRIAKIYYRNKNFKAFTNIMKQTNYKYFKIIIIISNFKHLLKKITSGCQKRCMSYQKCIEKLSIIRRKYFE